MCVLKISFKFLYVYIYHYWVPLWSQCHKCQWQTNKGQPHNGINNYANANNTKGEPLLGQIYMLSGLALCDKQLTLILKISLTVFFSPKFKLQEENTCTNCSCTRVHHTLILADIKVHFCVCPFYFRWLFQIKTWSLSGSTVLCISPLHL